MNCKKLVLTFWFLICGFVSIAYAQTKIVSGTVKDNAGTPIIGATIALEGTTRGVVTDLDGVYSLNVDGVVNPTIQLYYIGYRTQTAEVGTRNVIDFVVEEDPNKIDEVVVVGYGTQKRVSVTGAVNTVKTEDLAIASTSSLATTLTGRLPGLVVVQNSGAAGSSAADISIRGAGNPLVLVDGVERSFEDIDMDEVENITILKDASATAVYGIRGGNGVMIITTKRGKEGKFKIGVKSEFGLIHKSQAPEMLDSYGYAMLINEGLRNDKGIALDDMSYADDPFSAEDLALYKNGKSPLTHPSHNWMDYLTNDYGYRQKYGITLSGGNKFIKSFTSISYMNERDVYKDFDVDYDDTSNYGRYNIRTNLDMNISKTTVLSVDLGGQFSNRHYPDIDGGYNDLTKRMFISQPNNATLYEDKLVFIGDSNQSEEPLFRAYDVGYKDVYNNKLQFAASLNQNLDFITKGLSFRASVSYDHGFSNTYTASRANKTVYYPGFVDGGAIVEAGSFVVDAATGEVQNPITGEWISQDQVPLLSSGLDSRLAGSRSTASQSKVINLRGVLNYNRSFGKHNLAALGVFTTNVESYHSGSDSYVPYKFMEMAARASYNYDHKYFLEFNGGYNGSETFAPEHRFGFFPAVSAGWVLTEESFFPKNDVLTFMKFRGSYGTTGIDTSPNRFMYFDEWTLNYTGGYLFGYDGGSGMGTAYQTTAANLVVQWATNYQRNVGIETAWAGDRLTINADMYRYDKKGIMMMPNTVPSIVAGKLVAENMKEVRMEGYEIEARWKDKIGNVSYNLFANYNYANSINVFIDEVKPEYEWQEMTGKHPNQILALDCVGFYTEDDIAFLNKTIADNGGENKGTQEVPASAFGTADLQPGDLKYRDLNGDGIVDDNDMMYFENTTTPKTTFSFGAGMRWKGFGANIFFQGATDVTYLLSGNMRIPFQSGKTNGAAYILDRWTPERAAAGEEILFPRMSGVGGDADHNYTTSNFWMHDASYIRLKSVELSYSLKTDGLKKAGVGGINFTLSGSNLFTWSNLDFVDPETKSGSSVPIPPNQVYTLGIGLSF